MPNIAALVGLLLTLLGPIFYFLGEATHRHLTALIPVPFGLLIMGAGLAAKHPARRKQAMHLAAGVALIALLGSLMGLAGAIKRLNSPAPITGQGHSSPMLAVSEQSLMSVTCLLFLILCVRWFISNRRNKPKEA